MLKLNVGFTNEVGEANYGSRGAAVNLELKLDSSLVVPCAAGQAIVRRPELLGDHDVPKLPAAVLLPAGDCSEYSEAKTRV